ncbi:RagB/SusD family nutrient uptake outer membrane protein [Larkinella terrae]|uniref:RagB/SusD family nutrient uptake outer membrane protein n=1 Tax=Larkinella terrae TaxID=2025311 RepID=A0A7K0ETY0_9BACT|nr:RagB/SusD family nutrient uptake outer membrane protein [Larkinella terrae]MRS65277.1 RagB/SusD family nutrient uptake outer membrane protein [Larkinella terrae]
MKRRIYNLAGAIVLLLMAGCNTEFLKPKPLSFFSPETTFSDPEALVAGLVSCENMLRDEYLGTGSPITTQLVFSEVAIEGTTDAAKPSQNLNLQITPDADLNNSATTRIGWFWQKYYEGIRYANTVISRIDQPKYSSEKERNAILGAAYFHRAYRYYGLCHEFGDVPLELKERTGTKLDYYSTKREVILTRMKQDLEFAQEWVSDEVDKGAVTKGAVSHLLTKVNLALGLFDDAIKSASNVIDGGRYALMTSRFGVDKGNAAKNITWDLHRPENKALPENREALMLVIDRRNVAGNYTGANGSDLMYNAVPLWWNNILTPNGNRGTVDQAGINLDQVTFYGRGVGKARATWYTTHAVWGAAEKEDLRHAPGNWMRMQDLVYNHPNLKTIGDPYYGKPIQLFSSSGVLLCSDTIRNWFEWPQYKLYIPDLDRTPAFGGRTDWYVFRLAETYLLRAEAYFWKGDFALAAQDLNQVRVRANAQPLSPSAITIGTILDERARELYYEEHRKVELTRIAYILAQTGKTAYNGKTYSLANFSEKNFWFDRIMEKTEFYNKGAKTRYGNPYTISAYHVLWPVPASAISGNSRGVINQNFGYAGFERNKPALTAITDE